MALEHRPYAPRSFSRQTHSRCSSMCACRRSETFLKHMGQDILLLFYTPDLSPSTMLLLLMCVIYVYYVINIHRPLMNFKKKLTSKKLLNKLNLEWSNATWSFSFIVWC